MAAGITHPNPNSKPGKYLFGRLKIFVTKALCDMLSSKLANKSKNAATAVSAKVHLYIISLLPVFIESIDKNIRAIERGYKNIKTGMDKEIILLNPRFAIKNETMEKIMQYCL